MDNESIRQILTYRPISPGQLALMKVLYIASNGLSKREIADQARWGDVQSLNGVLMALNTRIGQTQYTYAYEAFFKVDGDHFTMREELRSVIDTLPGLHRVLQDLSVDEIFAEHKRDDESTWLQL